MLPCVTYLFKSNHCQVAIKELLIKLFNHKDLPGMLDMFPQLTSMVHQAAVFYSMGCSSRVAVLQLRLQLWPSSDMPRNKGDGVNTKNISRESRDLKKLLMLLRLRKLCLINSERHVFFSNEWFQLPIFMIDNNSFQWFQLLIVKSINRTAPKQTVWACRMPVPKGLHRMCHGQPRWMHPGGACTIKWIQKA